MLLHYCTFITLPPFLYTHLTVVYNSFRKKNVALLKYTVYIRCISKRGIGTNITAVCVKFFHRNFLQSYSNWLRVNKTKTKQIMAMIFTTIIVSLIYAIYQLYF